MNSFVKFTKGASLYLMCALVSSHATAQATSDNDAVVEQAGTDNAARVEQAGDLNRAGWDGQPLFQIGIFNELDVLQEGNSNSIGLSRPGLTQIGEQNTQSVFNRIFIRQTSDENVVGSVTQTSEGSVANGANTLTILQGGEGANLVEVVRQVQQDSQAAQIATVEQTGAFNRAALIDQLANSNLQGEENVITLRITGHSNGRTGLSGYAAQPSVVDSGIVQEGGNGDGRSNGNLVDMLITGDLNRFGIRQGGTRNDVGAITINGDANQLGLRQDGSDNDITIAPIEGNDNVIGIDQLGTNTAQLTLEAVSAGRSVPLSERNSVLILQDGTNFFSLGLEGDDNELTSNQDYDGARGGTNTARVRVIGDRNAAHLTQFGDNVFDLDIEGDDNNALDFDRSFDSAGQNVGVFVQEGAGNSVDVTMVGHSNRMGFSQSGTDNNLIGTILGGRNQMALVQIGSSNISVLLQSGQGNRMTIEQY